jgi:acetyl-CoA acetyltransferase
MVVRAASPSRTPRERNGYVATPLNAHDEAVPGHPGAASLRPAQPGPGRHPARLAAGQPADVTQERQDQWASRSHRLAAAARDAGRFDAEIVKVAERPEVRSDEGINGAITAEALAAKKPAFRPGGPALWEGAQQASRPVSAGMGGDGPQRFPGQPTASRTSDGARRTANPQLASLAAE